MSESTTERRALLRVADRQLADLTALAAKHGLNPNVLAQLVAEARTEARNRRRRLSDARLVELISAIGAD